MTTRQQPANASTGAHAPWRPPLASAKPACAASGMPMSETASRGNLQNQQRPRLRRETGRHRWSVSESSRTRAGAVRRREEPDPSSGSASTWPAAETWARRGHAARLQTQRHGHLVCRSEAANGGVYGLCQERHRHQEWLKFLRLLDQSMPAHLDLHFIVDNYATHKHATVQKHGAPAPLRTGLLNNRSLVHDAATVHHHF